MDVGWSVDLRTLILFGAVVTLLTDLFLLLSWKSVRGSARSAFRWWLLALLFYPIGQVFFSLRDILPPWPAVPLANTLLAVAMACMAIGLRAFYDLPERRLALLGLAALVGIGAAWFTLARPDLQLQIMLRETSLALLLSSAAYPVFRRGGPVGKVPRMTAALFVIAALILVLRAAHEFFWPTAWAEVMSPTVMNMLCLGVVVMLPLLATIGFLLMCAERGQTELERTARVDYLTGVFNRRAIEELAARAISGARRHGVSLAIMILDLDHFKRINDSHGHEAGDNALIETVRRMREIMRAEDLIGRLGGEEFVALMPDVDLNSAQAAAERLRRNFAEHPMFISTGSERIQITVTISIGVTALEPGDRLFSHLLRRADRAMYAAKAAGRNLVMVDAGNPAVPQKE